MFSFEGKFFRVTDAQLVPTTVQRPHPPMRMAASSAGTFRKVAEEGLPLFVGLRGDGLDELKVILRLIARHGGGQDMTATAAYSFVFQFTPLPLNRRHMTNHGNALSTILSGRRG